MAALRTNLRALRPVYDYLVFRQLVSGARARLLNTPALQQHKSELCIRWSSTTWALFAALLAERKQNRGRDTFCAAALGALLEGRHPPGSQVQDDSLGIDHYKALSFCASSRLLVSYFNERAKTRSCFFLSPDDTSIDLFFFRPAGTNWRPNTTSKRWHFGKSLFLQQKCLSLLPSK